MIYELERGMHMKWGIIATWRMALEGLTEGNIMLKDGSSAGDAVEEAIKMVEDFPYYKSVGYGGLPNENCVVELDAAYMDGDSLDIGAVAGIRDFKNPISMARKLSEERFNCFLVGTGAEEFGQKNGFERKNMLTERAIIQYKNKRKETLDKGLSPYDGHDTVGLIALDQEESMVVGTSTSGLFMKKPGRIGDSALSGSGFYVDSEIGAATATGLGEDIMKGCTSYEIVRLMKEGLSPQEAADKAVYDLDKLLKDKRGKAGDISVVCMNKEGEFGVGTNIDGFSFVVATDKIEPTVFLCRLENGKTKYEKADREWMDNFMKNKMADVTLK